MKLLQHAVWSVCRLSPWTSSLQSQWDRAEDTSSLELNILTRYNTGGHCEYVAGVSTRLP